MKDDTHGEATGTEPGRRYLTLLFADLSYSTELAEAMVTEHYAELLGAVRQIYLDTIPRYGGMVVRVQGDGLLALFGYPQTREDDGRNAVAATLELHQRVRELPIPLPSGFSPSLHSGLHSGLVLLRSGDIDLGRFELLGTVPNIAARLSSAAAPHEIMVSEETLGPASRFFVTSPPQLLKVKGRADPLLVYKVDARASASETFQRTRRSPTDFFGRDGQLALLERAMDDALGGRMRAVAVAAPPGMGKTRLIEQFLARVLQRGCTVLRGYCESSLGAEPLQPFRHMLQAVAAEAPATTPAAFEALFAGLAQEQPLVLFVDDWQWADNASHHVLASLRQRSGARLLVLLSMRDDALRAGPAEVDQTILLPPLTDAESLQVVAARLPGADPFVAERICRQASGNPLFLEELCHSAALGDVDRRPGRASGAGWLNHLVESRVQHLAPEQIEVVRVAAVIGNVVPAWLLEEITGQPVEGPLQRGLAEQDFLFAGERAGTLRFKHGLTRDIIYESVGLHARQQLHLRIAEALRRQGASEAPDESLQALALHYDAGGNAAQAAHFAELAGDKALAASALDRARALYRVALAALDRLPQTREAALRWIRIVERLGRVCVFDPMRSELALGERGLQLAEQHGDLATVARARNVLMYISYSMGDVRDAIAHGERGLVEARESGDEKMLVQTVAALGEAYCAAAQYDRALPLLDEAIAIKSRFRTGQRTNVGLAFTLVCRAYLLGDRGEFAQAEALFRQARTCIAEITHEIGATLNGWRAAVLLWQGRWAEAREAADESARHAEATHSLAQLSIARAESAYADWMLTQRPECLETLLEVLAWLKPRESALYRSLNHGWLADGLLAAGRRAEGRFHAAHAIRRGRQGDLLGLAMTYRALARDAAQHCPDRVDHYLQLATQASRQRGSAHELAATQLCDAQLAWQAGDGPRATALLGEATAAFTRMGMAWHREQAAALRRLVDAAMCSA
ncbi:ATP-binding protein [Ramlibacter sp. AN1133]|uniref:ATP-binding protein n=1 Tax=Ramlibacter sp. AN1133 TaxID=3133429 RepID=UPI0030BF24FA